MDVKDVFTVKLLHRVAYSRQMRSKNPWKSAQLKADFEFGGIAAAILGQCWDQLLSSAAKDEIFVVGRDPVSFVVIWGLLVDLVGDGFCKVKL